MTVKSNLTENVDTPGSQVGRAPTGNLWVVRSKLIWEFLMVSESDLPASWVADRYLSMFLKIVCGGGRCPSKKLYKNMMKFSPHPQTHKEIAVAD